MMSRVNVNNAPSTLYKVLVALCWPPRLTIKLILTTSLTNRVRLDNPCWIIGMTGSNYLAVTAIVSHLNNSEEEICQLLSVSLLPRYVVEVLMVVRVPSDGLFCHTFLANSHYTIGPTWSDQNYPPPPDPTHLQVVIS